MKSLWKVFVLVVAVGLLLAARPQRVGAEEAEGNVSRLAPSNLEFDVEDWDLKPLWRQDVIRRTKRKMQAIHYTGRFVAVEARDNTVYLIDANTGSVSGGTKLRNELGHGPVDLNEDEVVITVAGVFYKLNAKTNDLSDGWRMSIAPFTRPIIYDDYIIATDATVRMTAMDMETRLPQWMVDAKGPIMNRPVVDGEFIYAAGFRGDLVKTDASVGGKEWAWMPPAPSLLSTGVAVRDGSVYVGDLQGFVYALDADNAKVQWQQIAQLALIGQPLAVEGCVLFLSRKPNLVCMDVDAEGDKVAWKMPGVTSIVTTGKGRVYVMDADNRLSAVELETGETIWSDVLPDDTQVAGGEPGRGVFYISNKDGAMVGFAEMQD